MALKIFKLNGSDMTFEEISQGDFVLPVSLRTSPGGTAATTKLYLKNSIEDDDKYYTDIVLKPIATNGSDVVDGTISIKLISGDAQPSETRWDAAPINSAASIESPVVGQIDTKFPEIGSAAGSDLNYYPFWLRVSATKGTPIGSLQFYLKLDYTENLVA